MATPIKELFSQGVVTARDPSMLKDGEMAVAEDVIYRPNDPAIWKAPGRTAYGTVVAQSYLGVTVNSANITKSNAFGTAISVGITSGSTTITSAGNLFTALMVGMRVWGSGSFFSTPTYVRSFTSAGAVVLDRPAIGTGTNTVIISPVEPGDFVTGTGIQLNTKVLALVNASSLTLDTAATPGSNINVLISPPVKEVLYLSFSKSSIDQLLAYTGSRLYRSDYQAEDGVFSSFLTGLSNAGGETMEAIRIGNKYALVGAGNAPRAVYFKDVSGVSTLSTRILGMQPVTAATAVMLSANSWPSALGTGTYYFLITEVYNAGAEDEVEGTFSPPEKTFPPYVTISDITNQSVQVTRGPIVNTGTDGLTNAATHWRIYMSPSQPLTLPVPAYHLFRRVAEVSVVGPTASQAFTLSDVNPVTAPASGRVADNNGGAYTQGFFNQGGMLGAANQMSGTAAFANGAVSGVFTIASGTPTVGMPIYGTGIAPGTYAANVSGGASPFTIAFNKLTTAGASGTYFIGPSVSGDGVYTYDNGVATCAVRLSNFGFKNVGTYTGKTVIGVVVRLLYKWDTLSGSDDAGNDRGFNIKMTVGGADTNTKLNVGHASGNSSTPSFGGNRFGYINAGANGDTWGRTWNTGLQDFVDGNFFVHIVKAGSAQQQAHWIDAVEVVVYFSGVDVNLDGKPFPTVIYTTQVGEEVTIGAAGPSPPCDTGDVIDGQLVVNDTSNMGVIWASRPDDYEMFNAFYQINVNGNTGSRVMVIRKVGGVGVLFCRNAIKRLNYFPTEEDTTAQRGRAWQDISSDHGCASKRGVALFDMPGRGVIAAYTAPHGLMATDGIQSWPLNVDLDWPGTFDIARIDQCKLVNYPARYALYLYYVPFGGVYPTSYLVFSYHPSHVKPGGTLAALGPNQCRAAGACRTNLGNTTKLLTGNLSDGRVYLEDVGDTSEDLNVTIEPYIRGRLIYPDDVGGQGRIEKAYLRVGPGGTAVTGACRYTHVRQNIGEVPTEATDNDEPLQGNFTTDGDLIPDGNLVQVYPDVMSEAFQIQITKEDLDAPMEISYAALYGTGYGGAKP